jgi:hypothetical protein
MVDWLEQLERVWGENAETIGGGSFLALLVASGAAAFAVSLLYVRFHGARSTGSDVHRAFPLLGVSITAIFVCIQFSLPLSLGLLGALSIVRFRMPLKEPDEIGFLMVVIATSLACATGRLLFLGLVLVATVLVLAIQVPLAGVFDRRGQSGLIVATLPAAAYAESGSELLALLAGAARSGALESLTRQEGRVTVTWRFRGMGSAAAAALERELVARTRPESVAIVFASGPV